MTERTNMQPKFKKGDEVYVVANPEKKGIIYDEPMVLPESIFYSVFFSFNEKPTYKESQLTIVQNQQTNDIVNQIVNNNIETAPKFIQTLTLAKLNNPLTDNLYAFLSSRTEFNAFQFKPVLKFLNSPFQRILIADEVGVGKTIEAGIIYTELKARKELESVLIVCPNALMPKWQSEMRSRFDERFEILNSDRLKYIFNEISKGLDITNFRGICSLQLLRMEGNLTKLNELSLHFDLVIVDEAHHMRNKGNSYNLGMLLSYNSDAMVFLTATPLQLGNEDFFNLMHILLPDEFNDFNHFEKLVEPNQYLNAAYSLLKSNTNSSNDILDTLQKVERTSVGDRFLKSLEYLSIKELLQSSNQLELTDKLNIQNKLNALNPLSDVYTRTKKKDVMDAPIREPHFVHVTYTQEEKQFYDLVIEYAKYKFEQRNMGNQQGVGFATIMVQRQVASCIPAMIEYLNELLINKQTPKSTEDDEYIADDSSVEIGNLTEKIDEIEIEIIKKILLIGETLGDRDSKFDSFIETLNKLVQQNEIHGIIIFSYFRKTLEYLKKKTEDAGYNVGLIYGGIDLDDREIITEQFRSGEIQILLSSEVGGEGLDFQFCNCMINYDLPWNPMRVEQRIGRLDRYGQLSPKILIYNFSVEDTVESRIFGRLYQRIQIFEKYIGELEGILGKEIRDLTKLVVSTKLTPEEEEKKIENIHKVIELKKIELKEFEKESGKFIGQDDFFTEEIANIQKTNRFISEEEMQNFVGLFLDEYFPKVKFIQKDDDIYTLKPEPDFISFLIKEKKSFPQNKRFEVSSFIKKLENDDLTFTFNSNQACIHKNMEFLTLKHPMVKCIISFINGKNNLNNTGEIIIESDTNHGNYLFFTYLIKINAAKTMLEMHTVVIDIDSFEINEFLSENFNNLLLKFKNKTAYPDVSLSENLVVACEQKSLEYITQIQDKKEKEIRRSNNVLIDSQIESQTAFFNHKIGLADKMHLEVVNEKIKTMKQREAKRLRAELKEKIEALERRRLIDISFNLVAGGLLFVEPKME